jgi:hypothetical protein
MIISSSLTFYYGSFLKAWTLGGSRFEEGADIGETFEMFETTCFASVFNVRVLAIDVPDIVAAGRFRFGVFRLFELGGRRKLDKNIFERYQI